MVSSVFSYRYRRKPDSQFPNGYDHHPYNSKPGQRPSACEEDSKNTFSMLQLPDYQPYPFSQALLPDILNHEEIRCSDLVLKEGIHHVPSISHGLL
jgi:hypothetical protein